MTSIEWTNKTWNPVTGCNKVSPGCAHCYAEGIAKRFWGDRKFTDVQFHPERLEQPLKVKKPTTWFVNSMSDLFHESVTDEQIDQVFAAMALTPQHTYQCLTKRPQRMLEYLSKTTGENNVLARVLRCAREIRSRLPRNANVAGDLGWPYQNIWLGVSVENQKAADDRIPLLLQTPAAVRFLSCEPLLEKIDIEQWLDHWHLWQVGITKNPKKDKVDWIIVGGESGAGARYFDLDWARSLRDQCASAGVAFFLKQLGNNHGDRAITLKCRSGKCGDIEQFPEDLRIRQFPAIASQLEVSV